MRVHLNATQQRNCLGQIWSNDPLVIRVPARVLAQYPAEQHHWKEGQLEANLKVAVMTMVDAAAEKIALRPCAPNGPPQKIEGFGLASILDLLL